jgi:hypothetical protein
VSVNHGGADYWIVKLKPNGEIAWQKSFGGSADDIATCIQQTADEGYIVSGSSLSWDGDISSSHGFADYWIVKLDSAGTIQWQKSLGGSNSETAYSVQQTTDNGYIVAGESFSTDGDVGGMFLHGIDAWIVKLKNDVLAVNLFSFSAVQKNDAVQLTWEAGASSNDYFIIQRSMNTTNFAELTKIASKGYSSEPYTYSYMDNEPFKGNNFYRLKQVDKEGHTTYSNIVSVNFENAVESRVYPNPVLNILNIDGLIASINHLSIIDAHGKVVANATTTAAHYTINVQKLPKGVYYLRIEGNGQMSTTKFVKQ